MKLTKKTDIKTKKRAIEEARIEDNKSEVIEWMKTQFSYAKQQSRARSWKITTKEKLTLANGSNLDNLQHYVYKSRYARWIPAKKRREHWSETVERYCDFWRDKYGDLFPYKDVYEAIHKMEVMPSMRALMTAGEALNRDNIAGYNCSYLPIQDQKCFDEVMYVLMNGTGVGFSVVERQYINKLPECGSREIRRMTSESTIVVADSKQVMGERP